MRFRMKGARLAIVLAPALALAAPAFALSDSQEPGSVIVFPKFIQGTVAVDGATAPITELEIGTVCPKGVVCPEHMPIKIRFHWVCGTTEADAATSFICKETDWDVTATIYEKIVLTTNGESVSASGVPNHFSPPPGCPQNGGYLIGWVINTSDVPIAFDALIGDAHLRPGSAGVAAVGSSTALADYTAIPIQAVGAAGSVITTTATGGLIFDGADAHYQSVTGQVLGDVRYTNTTTGPTFALGALTLLTLDVVSNRPNVATFVDLDFFGGNPSAIGNENQVSTSTEFICWEQIPLTGISTDLTTAVMGRKGVFVSRQAMNPAGLPVTLLGLSEVLEGPVAAPPWARASFTNLFNSSVPVPTTFFPTPSPNPLLVTLPATE